MQRILNAVRFAIKREIKVSDPAVRAEGEAHLAALDELEAEFSSDREDDRKFVEGVAELEADKPAEPEAPAPAPEPTPEAK